MLMFLTTITVVLSSPALAAEPPDPSAAQQAVAERAAQLAGQAWSSPEREQAYRVATDTLYAEMKRIAPSKATEIDALWQMEVSGAKLTPDRIAQMEALARKVAGPRRQAMKSKHVLDAFDAVQLAVIELVTARDAEAGAFMKAELDAFIASRRR